MQQSRIPMSIHTAAAAGPATAQSTEEPNAPAAASIVRLPAIAGRSTQQGGVTPTDSLERHASPSSGRLSSRVDAGKPSERVGEGGPSVIAVDSRLQPSLGPDNTRMMNGQNSSFGQKSSTACEASGLQGGFLGKALASKARVPTAAAPEKQKSSGQQGKEIEGAKSSTTSEETGLQGSFQGKALAGKGEASSVPPAKDAPNDGCRSDLRIAGAAKAAAPAMPDAEQASSQAGPKEEHAQPSTTVASAGKGSRPASAHTTAADEPLHVNGQSPCLPIEKGKAAGGAQSASKTVGGDTAASAAANMAAPRDGMVAQKALLEAAKKSRALTLRPPTSGEHA